MKEIFDIVRFSFSFSLANFYLLGFFMTTSSSETLNIIYGKILRTNCFFRSQYYILTYTYWITYIVSNTKIYASFFSMENNKFFSHQKVLEYLEIPNYSE